MRRHPAFVSSDALRSAPSIRPLAALREACYQAACNAAALLIGLRSRSSECGGNECSRHVVELRRTCFG
jgi:hypothetical protein